MNSTIRLLLVDDHSVMRAGLANMLSTIPDFEVVGEADDCESAFQLHRQLTPDVTLLDISMPGENGLVCLELILANNPDSCVLMLSSSESELDVQTSMRRGARGFILKSARPSELIDAIRSAYHGETMMQPELKSRLLASEANKLTAREIDVLKLLRKGLSNPDIGKELGISSRTAKAHVASIMGKLHAIDRTQVVAIAFEKGLLKP